jgi:hypothetical protein
VTSTRRGSREHQLVLFLLLPLQLTRPSFATIGINNYRRVLIQGLLSLALAGMLSLI